VLGTIQIDVKVVGSLESREPMMIRDGCLGFLYLPSFERRFMLVVESRMSMMMANCQMKSIMNVLAEISFDDSDLNFRLETRGCYTVHSRVIIIRY
jgi:hypothetical protein